MYQNHRHLTYYSIPQYVHESVTKFLAPKKTTGKTLVKHFELELSNKIDSYDWMPVGQMIGYTDRGIDRQIGRHTDVQRHKGIDI